MSRNRNQMTPGGLVSDVAWSLQVKKTMTFDGGTTNDPGDFDGTGNPATLFTVTGPVLLEVIGYCTTDLAGASATVEVGFTGDTAQLLAQVTGTTIDQDEIWHDATVDAKIEASSVAVQRIVNNTDVIQTVATANLTGGVIDYVAYWYPLSPDASVVAA